MSIKAIDLKLRKIEKDLNPPGLAHLSEEQLTTIIRRNLEVATVQYDGNALALCEEMAASGEYELRQGAQRLTDLINSDWNALYPDAIRPGQIPESAMPI